MNNQYNANIYLSKTDINNVENKIEELTDEIQEKIFNEQTSPLRNIQVGDNLNGRTLYLFFPIDIYQYISDNENRIINTTNNHYIRFFKNNSYNSYDIGFYYDKSFTFYRRYSNGVTPFINRIRYKLPYDFGVVTEIDTNNEIYQYIKIYNDERLIPNYEKHVWVNDDVLSMQKIDNIENGIKNIGYYYTKPKNWITTRQWLKTCNIKDYDNNTNTQNISYIDLNRWLNDLDLINFENLDKMTIWNSSVSEIDWNEENDTDWEEL